MPALCRRLNARNIELYPHTRGETVAVKLTSGEVRHVRWIGFIDLEVARAIKQAIPVKLDVTRYSNKPGAWASDWVDLKPGEYVQGCLTVEGVYAVLATGVRIVGDSSHRR